MIQSVVSNIRRHGIEFFGRYYSLYPGKIISVDDPDFQGRIKVAVPALTGSMTEALNAFAYPLYPPGFFLPPKVGDTVEVMFDSGDPRAPRYVGQWILQNQLPTEFQQNPPTKRFWKSPDGHIVILSDDTTGDGQLVELRHKDETSTSRLRIRLLADHIEVQVGNGKTIRLGNLDAIPDRLDNLATAKSMDVTDGHIHIAPNGPTTGPLGPTQIPITQASPGIPPLITTETKAT
jgi:hypothetical protein